MGGLGLRVMALVPVLILLASPALAMSPRKSNETGMVRVLYIGYRPMSLGPYRAMVQDPFLDVTPVKASRVVYRSEDIRKSIRVYVPRSYRDLTEREDVIIISDANADVFETRLLKWVSDAVTEDGLGFLMTGGREAFGGYMAMPDWTRTPVGRILPVEAPIRESGPASRVRILKWENRLIASLPWSKIGEYGIFYGFNTVVERKGSEVLAELVAEPGEPRGNMYPRNPFLVWWDVGKGRSFAMTSGWTPANAGAFVKWEYYPDYAVNLILFVADLPVPSDPVLVHRIRSGLDQFYLMRDFIISMIEFIDQFGANPRTIEELLSTSDKKLKEVNALYLDYDFEASLARVDELITDLGEATKLALQLKDQALFWVYLVEWSAVTGTLCSTGALLWTIMIRKRLYRAVRTTRITHL